MVGECVCIYTFVFKAGWPTKLPRELFKSIDSLGALPPEILLHRRSDEGSEGIFQVKPGKVKLCQAACAEVQRQGTVRGDVTLRDRHQTGVAGAGGGDC